MKRLVTAAFCSLAFFVGAEAQLPEGKFRFDSSRSSAELRSLLTPPTFNLFKPDTRTSDYRFQMPGKNFYLPDSTHWPTITVPSPDEKKAIDVASIDPGIIIYPSESIEAYIIPITPPVDVDPKMIRK